MPLLRLRDAVCRAPARPAARRTAWPRADPASSGWPRRWPSLLPGARTVIATSDTLHGPAAAADLVERIEAHEVDLIIGTQIIAKGYHFPLLTLVGVVDADLGLAGGDLRASERTFQLLYQVGGRAGRVAAGRVLLQTFWPEHPVIAALASGDRERFLATEEAERRAAACRRSAGWRR